MKKARKSQKRTPLEKDWLPKEVDFSRGQRGVTAKRFARGTNLVALAPDVAAAFPTAEAVNKALRTLIDPHAA